MSPRHRVIVHAWEDETVEVKKEEDIIIGEPSQSFRSCPNNVIEDYTKLHVSSWIDQISIVFDSERESNPTTKATSAEGRGNEVLRILHLWTRFVQLYTSISRTAFDALQESNCVQMERG